MTATRKSRHAMLDGLAAAAPALPSSMMGTSRALRAAREAVDAHKVWELDPAKIALGDRPSDRFDPSDVADLRAAMEANGQAVPILVRRDPDVEDRYLLVYGRRRLEAVRRSDTLTTVRALVAHLGDEAALRAQVGENAARRDLTFIEKAAFAAALLESGFGTRAEVAEVLGVTPSSVSMALGVIEAVGPDLRHAIGPAPGIGRPRWQELAARVSAHGDAASLIDVAVAAHASAARDVFGGELERADEAHPSVTAFQAVLAAAAPARAAPVRRDLPRPLAVEGRRVGTLRRTASGLRIDLKPGPLADRVEAALPGFLAELQAREGVAD